MKRSFFGLAFGAIFCEFMHVTSYSMPAVGFVSGFRDHGFQRFCCSSSRAYIVKASLEQDLGKPFGDVGRNIGKAIDWFFDTSHVTGAKAWRLQEVVGEGDSVRWRDADALAEGVREKVKELRMDEGKGAMVLGDGDYFSNTQDSYSMSDEDLERALTERLGQLAQGIKNPQGMADKLTGIELAQLCHEKYGLYHDMAIKCDKLQLVSDKKLVSLNIYYSYVGQIKPKFQYTETEYLIKLEALAELVNKWGQQDYVRSFFAERPTAYRGLPSRPRWDTAVSIRLYKSPTWDEQLVGDWFMV